MFQMEKKELQHFSRRKSRRKKANAESRMGNYMAPIQRLVGFEFQTVGGNWNVLKAKEELERKEGKRVFTGENPGHNANAVIKGFSGFNMEYDGSDLEYVTEPRNESNPEERSQLIGYVRAAGEEHKGLKNRARNAYVKLRNDELKEVIGIENGTELFLINPEGQQYAHPQATAGIKKEKLFDLLKRLLDISAGNERIRAYSFSSRKLYETGFGHSTFQNNANFARGDLAESQRDAMGQAVSAVERSSCGIAAKGFIALLEQFISVNEESNKNIYEGKEKSYQANAKNKTPVMPRTNLDVYFHSLDGETQQQIMLYLHSKYDSSNNPVVFRQGIGDKEVKTMLSEMMEGWEKILEKGWEGHQRTWKNKYHGIGHSRGLPNSGLDIGNGVEGIIVEMRSLPNNIPPEEWSRTASIVMKLVDEVNNKCHLLNQRRAKLTIPKVPNSRQPNAGRVFNSVHRQPNAGIGSNSVYRQQNVRRYFP